MVKDEIKKIKDKNLIRKIKGKKKLKSNELTLQTRSLVYKTKITSYKVN